METIFRLFEKMWNRLVNGPEKQEYQPELPIDTFCPVCNWSGNYIMTLIQDKTNDRCPKCGNTYLDYVI
jgi:rubrerythrin